MDLLVRLPNEAPAIGLRVEQTNVYLLSLITAKQVGAIGLQMQLASCTALIIKFALCLEGFGPGR